LLQRAKAVHLHGLVAHWAQIVGQPWREPLSDGEEQERQRRSLERRLQAAHIGSFKAVCDFDWTWPKRGDRAALEALMTLDFLKEAANVVLIGPNGVGKSMWAQNLAHQAVLHGATGLFTPAGQLLGELASLDSDSGLRRRLRHYAAPDLLVIDEVGYLSYGNRPFAEWGEVFPNAACVVSLIDRLIHTAEVIAIEGESYRLKEAKERSEQRAKRRRKKTEEPA
jgi:DNA replication protein DnaC